MTIIYNESGKIISRSKNLQGMLRYAQCHVPVAASFDQAASDMSKYWLTLYFDNGAYAVSEYADPSVCADFLANRRSWPPLAVFGHPTMVKRYCGYKGEAATLRMLLADLVSESSRSGPGNPWRLDAMRRASGYLTGDESGIIGVDRFVSPRERRAGKVQYNY